MKHRYKEVSVQLRVSMQEGGDTNRRRVRKHGKNG